MVITASIEASPAVRSRPHAPVRGRGLVVLGLCSVASMCIYVALPSAPADTFFQLVAWGSLVAFAIGIHRNGGFTLPWLLIGVGWTSFSIGDCLFSLYDHVFDSSPFPSVADVFYLVGYPFIAVGLAALVRRSRPDGDRIALIDAGIVVVPTTVAAWIYLIQPTAAGDGIAMLNRLVSAAYPIGDLLCVAVLIRLFAGPVLLRRSAQPAMTVLGIGLMTMLAADVWFMIAQLHGAYSPGGWGDAMQLVPYLCLATVASHPSVARIGDPLPSTDPSLGLRRLVLLTVAALVTPGILVIQWTSRAAMAVPLIVAGTAASFLLVIMRMAALVEALEDSRAELAHDASHDHLTGLANLSLFTRRIDALLSRGQSGALLFIDLDNFKRVNDRCGHRAGDDMLVRVAERLRMAVRSGDTVSRLAGDEFGVLLPGADQVTADALATRLVDRLAMSSPHTDSTSTVVSITASIGSVSWGAASGRVSAQELLAEADRAMYSAKAGAGNRFVAVRA